MNPRESGRSDALSVAGETPTPHRPSVSTSSQMASSSLALQSIHAGHLTSNIVGTKAANSDVEARSHVDSQSDIDLLHAWKAGDQRAGAALYRRHARSVTRFFRNKVAEHEIADLLQATFMACFEHSGRYRGDASFRAFVLAFARNHLLHHYRVRYRKHDKIDFGVSSIIDLGLSPSSVMDGRQEQRRLLAALRSLAIEQQILLELFYWEDMPGAELAELYGVAEGTIRSRLRRARELLLQAYDALDSTRSGAGSVDTSIDSWVQRIREQVGG